MWRRGWSGNSQCEQCSPTMRFVNKQSLTKKDTGGVGRVRLLVRDFHVLNILCLFASLGRRCMSRSGTWPTSVKTMAKVGTVPLVE